MTALTWANIFCSPKSSACKRIVLNALWKAWGRSMKVAYETIVLTDVQFISGITFEVHEPTLALAL